MSSPTLQNRAIVTADGSHSLRSARFGVTYHSTHGALQESRHVFIEAGLLPRLEDGVRALTILEMGFGTGLNALLVRLLANQYPGVVFHFVTFERYPIPVGEARELNYPDLLNVDKGLFLQLHLCAWNEVHRLGSNFHFLKHHGNFLTTQLPAQTVDVIFYDAFSPESQPEFWAPPAIGACLGTLRPGGWLVTYCAKGQFKRDLRAAGFGVEALVGPPGKREMTRATAPIRLATD